MELIENYTEKSFVLIGDSLSLYDKLKPLGIWIKLKYNGGTKGWVFANKHLEYVKSLVENTTAISVIDKHFADVKALFEPKVNVYSKAALKDYLIKNIPVLLKTLISEFSIGSVVMNDTKILPDDGKRYLFLGAGMGFSTFKYDKRNKLITKIVKDSSLIRPIVEKELILCIDKAYLNKLEKSGCPIQATLVQNLNYKATYNNIVYDFMKLFVDTEKSKVYVENRLD